MRSTSTERELLEAIPSPEPLTNLFLARVAQSPDRTASHSRVDGRWVGTTWREFRQAVDECALGLLDLGAERGSRIALFAGPRKEWVQMDLAILALGAITVGVNKALTGPQVRELLLMSGARIVFVDDRADRLKVAESTADLSPAVQIITMEQNVDAPRVVSLDEIRRRGAKRRHAHPDEMTQRYREVQSSDIASYVYTAGTTGRPKGAMLSHANFHYVIHATRALIPHDGERTLAFLPLDRAFDRCATYLAFISNVDVYFEESMERLTQSLVEVRPSYFASVPHALGRMHHHAVDRVSEAPPWLRRIYDGSVRKLVEVEAIRRRGGVPGVRARVASEAADRVVGHRFREELGGRVKFICSSGAPLDTATQEFFESVGVPILDGYGLTETCGTITLNTLENRRLATVGRPLPGTSVRIAEDREIWVRGPGLFGGYHDDLPATEAAFDEEGWFRTGDVGSMSRDGFLEVTDRKRDLLITPGGRMVEPQSP